jgi:hypothetical protein
MGEVTRVFQAMVSKNGAIQLGKVHIKKAAAAEELAAAGNDGLALVRTDFVEVGGTSYSIPQIIERVAPAEVLEAWKAQKVPARKLEKKHIGFNYQRWNDGDNVKEYAGVSRLLVEPWELPNDSWDAAEAVWRDLEWRKALVWGGGYACISSKPFNLRWSGHEDCGWWNEGTDGSKREHYTQMGEIVRRFVNTHKGHINYLELENEPQRWWMDDSNKYTPVQFYAMQAYMYDLVKAIDPSIQVVIAGMSWFDRDFIAEAFEGKNRSFDILSFHYYSSNKNDIEFVKVNEPCPPAACKFELACKNTIAYCNKAYPGIPVWLGEFGYSSNESTSVVHEQNLELPPNEGSLYTMQMAEIAVKAGFSQVQIFLLHDLNDSDLYGRCGHYFSAEEPGGKAQSIKKLGAEFLKLYNVLPD